MENLIQDCRYGIRMLLKNPGFTAIAVLTLTLGIGANSAIFSVVNAVLLQPLPYDHPDRLVILNETSQQMDSMSISYPNFVDWRDRNRVFEQLAVYRRQSFNLTGGAKPEQIVGGEVSASLFPALRTQPVLGRSFTENEDKPGGAQVVVLSYGLWQSRFSGSKYVAGQSVNLNDKQHTVIGVMPAGFEFPTRARLWVPVGQRSSEPAWVERGNHPGLYGVARISDGATIEAAHGDMDRVAQELQRQYPGSNTGDGVRIRPMKEVYVADIRPALLVLFAAVGFVLLIACVNVANLLLARAESRGREIAIRNSLGAGLARLARQFITEGVLLSACGALLGLLLAFGGLRLIQLTNAGSVPRASEIGIDLRVLLFTIAAALFTGILFGLAPLFSVAVKNLQDSLKDTAGSLTANSAAQGFRKILVAGELAMALVLLIGCGLMIRGFWKLQEVRTGINAENVITMKIALPGLNYAKGEQTAQFWRRLDEKIGNLPGATSAAIGSGLPPIRPPDMNDTKIERFVHQPGGPIENVDYYNVVSKDFFHTLGIRLMDGRLFDARDVHGSPHVAIVNQTMARTFWGNETPLGHRIQPGMNGPMCTIIGVVEDVKNAGLDKPTGTEIFLPYAQEQGSGNRAASVFLRSRGDPSSLGNAVRSAVRSIDPMIPVTNVQTVEQVLVSARSRPRFLTLLLVLLSIVALVIATVGIYSVISFSVARRSKEFALRMALGAQPKDVLGLVMKQGAAVALSGIAAGVLGTFALTRLMASLLFDVRPTDALTFISVSALLAVVALCASFVPAQRATQVDPMRALRHE